MKNKDHRLLADFLMAEIGCFVPNMYRKAFVIGNIEPDKNPFTYLRGVTQEEKFRGHNYGNILPVMRKLFYSIHRKSYFGIRDYYRLGKLIHYVADAFTFPHNREFEGTLKEHCEYERALRERIYSMLQNPEFSLQRMDGIESFESIEELHQEYIQKAGSFETDCKYILLASQMLIKSQMEKLLLFYWATSKEQHYVQMLGQ